MVYPCFSPYKIQADEPTRLLLTRSMSPAASRNTILRLINAAQHSACPCHSCSSPSTALPQIRKFATPVNSVPKEYAFEVAASNLRFGDGVTAEVGMDLKNMKARKVLAMVNAIDLDNQTFVQIIGRSVHRSKCGQAYCHENCELGINYSRILD